MVEQATFLLQKLEFENMVMSMLIINPGLFTDKLEQAPAPTIIPHTNVGHLTFFRTAMSCGGRNQHRRARETDL